MRATRIQRTSRGGVTIIELMVVMAVLGVAVVMFTSMVIETAKQRGINRENAIASNAARIMVEQMRNENFLDAYAMFNQDPDDDPGGAGTAPGHLFEVAGLNLLPTTPDGMVGLVEFPEMLVQPPTEKGQGKGESSPPLEWQLREDYVSEKLGLPRDLNGDSIIDQLDHEDDYFILPVHIVIEWRGSNGPRRIDLYNQLSDIKKF